MLPINCIEMVVRAASRKSPLRTKVERELLAAAAMASPSIRYLLPLSHQQHHHHSWATDSDGDCSSSSNCGDADGDDDQAESVDIYQQAKPLVHPHSSAAIKTLGRMLNDPELMRRMLKRHQRAIEDGGLPPPSIDADTIPVLERLQFMAVCEEMAIRFDPQSRQTRELPLLAVKQLLGFYDLRVDDVAFRRWEQRVPKCADKVSIPMLSQALLLWFDERFVIEHFKKLQERSATEQTTVDHQGRGNRHTSGDAYSRSGHIEKSHSAPYLHPFERLKQQHDVAAAFDYEKFASQPPVGCFH